MRRYMEEDANKRIKQQVYSPQDIEFFRDFSKINNEFQTKIQKEYKKATIEWPQLKNKLEKNTVSMPVEIRNKIQMGIQDFDQKNCIKSFKEFTEASAMLKYDNKVSAPLLKAMDSAGVCDVAIRNNK